jgi:WD40 repeat protein
MDLKTSCAVGGRPGALHVSPDGSRLHVFDQEAMRMSVVGVASWQLLDQVDLGLSFMAGFGESIFLRGCPGKVEVFNAASRRFSGAIPCSGDACDVAFLPELREAVLTTSSGRDGHVELVALSPVRTMVRMEMPLPPVRDSLALLPSHGLGALVIRDADRRDEAVALFECRSGEEPRFLRMEGGVRSVAFEPGGKFLYAACHDDSTLAVIDVRERRVVERIHLAGKPYSVVCDPVGRRIWVLCEKLGHLAMVDPGDHTMCRLTQLPGLKPGARQVAFSPEGRLAVVPQLGDGSLALIEGGTPCAGYGELDDALELGREVGEVAWSPLGEEVYAASPGAGEVLRLSVDRGDQEMKDTDLYLMDQLLRQEDPAGYKNPLFPP